MNNSTPSSHAEQNACYLCNNTSFKRREGQVRDAPHLAILECTDCGLVTLGCHDHIQSGHYERSGMYGGTTRPIDALLRDSNADDERRFDMLRSYLPNKRVLDFGCGNGGFLLLASTLAASVTGVELETRVREHWNERLTILPNLPSPATHRSQSDGFDLITAFHVIEHLPDPLAVLSQMQTLLAPSGQIIIEVPSSDDALLTLYLNAAFQRFTYWSQHLFMFNAATLKTLAVKSGLSVKAIRQFQRYPLSNHLYWLSHGRPGGHQQWAFLDSPQLNEAYSASLATIGKCDSLIAYLEAT
ncbi:MAG: class I SAM-dependent methyltransferase [Chromatiaceae bacterium]|nr:class I SAM-dependent methyltransferase [Chromatiaceae bacterium]